MSKIVTYDIDDVLGMLRALCDKEGGQRAFALKHHLSEQYVSDVLNSRRDPGNKILNPLGLARVSIYVPSRISDMVQERTDG